MRASPSVLLATIFLLFTTFTAAWPWPRFGDDVDFSLVRRQDDGDNGDGDQADSTTAPAKVSATPSVTLDDDTQSQTMSITSAPKATTSGSSNKDEGDNTDSESQSGSSRDTRNIPPPSNTRTTTSTSRTRTATTRKAYDPRFPAGGITMLEPSPTGGVTPLYKVGDTLTFAFSMTSVKAYPTAVNIYATCSANNALYTIAENSTVKEGQDKKIYWDTSKYGNDNPMLTEKYSLVIWDADLEENDTPASGYLATFKGLVFAMYLGKPYYDEPGNHPKCATCSAGSIEKVAVGLALVMGVAAVLGGELL